MKLKVARVGLYCYIIFLAIYVHTKIGGKCGKCIQSAFFSSSLFTDQQRPEQLVNNWTALPKIAVILGPSLCAYKSYSYCS